MKNIIKLFLKKISRIIYYLIPNEIKHETKLTYRLDKELINETYNYFKNHFENSIIFRDSSRKKIRKYAIESSLLNDQNKEYYYLEFGVFKGESSNFFSEFVKKLYCFDGFEGLKEDWWGSDNPKKAYSLNNKIPKLNSNVELVIGWVEDTLDDFLNKHNPKINFVHFDMDTYSPTKFTLKKIKPYLVKNSIIIFDELYNYTGWKNGEFKALMEVFKHDEFKYKAFNLDGRQCVIEII